MFTVCDLYYLEDFVFPQGHIIYIQWLNSNSLICFFYLDDNICTVFYSISKYYLSMIYDIFRCLIIFILLIMIINLFYEISIRFCAVIYITNLVYAFWGDSKIIRNKSFVDVPLFVNIYDRWSCTILIVTILIVIAL
jgi:hypothetical protein